MNLPDTFASDQPERHLGHDDRGEKRRFTAQMALFRKKTLAVECKDSVALNILFFHKLISKILSVNDLPLHFVCAFDTLRKAKSKI